MTDIFFSLMHNAALLMGTTDTIAGLILSMVTIAAFFMTFLIFFSMAKIHMNFMGIIIAAALGVVFCTGVGWLQPWAAILILALPIFVWALGVRGSSNGE